MDGPQVKAEEQEEQEASRRAPLARAQPTARSRPGPQLPDWGTDGQGSAGEVPPIPVSAGVKREQPEQSRGVGDGSRRKKAGKRSRPSVSGPSRQLRGARAVTQGARPGGSKPKVARVQGVVAEEGVPGSPTGRGVATVNWSAKTRSRAQCQEAGCAKQPFFGHEGDARPTFCATHCLDGMVDVKNPRGQDKECPKMPHYGREGESRATFCAVHRLDGMVTLNSRRCQDKECTKQPSFGHEGDTRPTFCAGHRLEGMTDLKGPRYQDKDCTKQPSFGHQGDPRPTFCTGHRLEGMVNLKGPHCRDMDCTKRPNFGHEGDLHPTFCASHSLEGMVGLRKYRYIL